MSKDTEELYDFLIDNGIVSEETLAVVTSINGTNLDTLESILYVKTGYRSLEQIREEF